MVVSAPYGMARQLRIKGFGVKGLGLTPNVTKVGQGAIFWV